MAETFSVGMYNPLVALSIFFWAVCTLILYVLSLLVPVEVVHILPFSQRNILA